MRKVFLGIIVFLIPYTFFWIHFFHVTPYQKSKTISPTNVLAESSNSSPRANVRHPEGVILDFQEQKVPEHYIIPLAPRKQVFNLSCEFAAAASIIYHYKNDEFFSPKNELLAEKALIAKIPASLNPNIGIRMGQNATTSAELLYLNLDKRFGGTDYYGIHAPPFIDVFWEYGLMARPIQKGDIEGIKKAIFSGHLVMAWIKIGYGKTVDVALSYGSVPVIRGEHALVLYGYNQDGVFVMDPGIGMNRFIKYQTLLDATNLFPLPFLEVNPSIKEFAYDPTERIDNLTGLDRSVIKILVQNGSSEIGAGNTMAEILLDFGYHVKAIEKAGDLEREGISILLKKDLSDYELLIKRDISLAGYHIASFSATLASSDSLDAIVIVGE